MGSKDPIRIGDSFPATHFVFSPPLSIVTKLSLPHVYSLSDKKTRETSNPKVGVSSSLDLEEVDSSAFSVLLSLTASPLVGSLHSFHWLRGLACFTFFLLLDHLILAFCLLRGDSQHFCNPPLASIFPNRPATECKSDTSTGCASAFWITRLSQGRSERDKSISLGRVANLFAFHFEKPVSFKRSSPFVGTRSHLAFTS